MPWSCERSQHGENARESGRDLGREQLATSICTTITEGFSFLLRLGKVKYHWLKSDAPSTDAPPRAACAWLLTISPKWRAFSQDSFRGTLPLKHFSTLSLTPELFFWIFVTHVAKQLKIILLSDKAKIAFSPYFWPKTEKKKSLAFNTGRNFLSCERKAHSPRVSVRESQYSAKIS